MKRLWRWLRMSCIGYYRDGDDIVHWKYGRYPKRVAFSSGMTLYPQQEAVFTVGWFHTPDTDEP